MNTSFSLRRSSTTRALAACIGLVSVCLLQGCSESGDASTQASSGEGREVVWAGSAEQPHVIFVQDEQDPPDAGQQEPIDFSRDILPILSNSCFHCHGPDQDSKEAKEAGFRLDDREDAIAMFAIVPGDAADSSVIDRVTTSRDSLRMPPAESNKPRLTPGQVELLERWINEGAEYTDHWSFVKPVKPELPEISDPDWPSNAIDYFIHDGLSARGLSTMPQADKRRLIRRASLDLIGLPPTPEQVEQFVNDTSPDAYEKLVDRLLESQHFGEHWARQWLDAARYADSQGFEKDRPRTMWRYRDWVINAYNGDMPFDQFTHDQIAGDLVADPTSEQLIATGFHRNTNTNTEGGTDDEEFRSAAVIDRTNTTMEVWMGMTMACAQCHTHKYDPIYHDEYFQMYAFFNQTADNDRYNDAPFIQAPTPQQAQEMAAVRHQIRQAEQSLGIPGSEIAKAQQQWEQNILGEDKKWTVLDPSELSATGGVTLTELDDHSVLASGENPAKTTYTLTANTDLPNITAIRLEAIADDRLPGADAGRAEEGGFMVSRISAQATAASAEPISARFVRVDLPGDRQILSLAEVEVFSAGENVAVGTKAVQSSTDQNGQAFFAIDGTTDGDFEESMTTHTRAQNDPWWEADLGASKPIEKVVIWNRTDNNHHTRLAGAIVTLLDAERKPIWQARIDQATKQEASFEVGQVQQVVFTDASATSATQDGAAGSAIGLPGVKGKGWSIPRGAGGTQYAIFQTGANLSRGEQPGTTLKIQIEQNQGQQQTLGRFRLSVTNQPRPVSAVPREIRDILIIDRDERTEAQALQVYQYFIETAPAAKPLRDEIETLKRQLTRIENQVPTALVMQELPEDQHRETYLFKGGSFLAPDKEGGIMRPDTPEVFHPFPEDAPKNRLGLAQWLVHADNPLTARVQVNRVWEQLFGIGLVETSNDFGFQGSYPTNKPLLDYLAVTYQQDMDWSTKSLIKLIVTSSAYKQSSKVSSEQLEIDPFNKFVSRGPRLRLSAEQIRDQALFVAGLLDDDRIGGPSVMPYMPEGMLPQAFDTYVQQTSGIEDVYRRGLYTAWRRTGHYPSFAAFDAPSREICVVKRSVTNTPLQALVTLNDPVYVEAAQGLGRLLIQQAGDDLDARIELAFERALARKPSEPERGIMKLVYEQALADYQENREAATQMATEPRGPLPEGMDVADAAAMTVVGNVMLNLDELLNKP